LRAVGVEPPGDWRDRWVLAAPQVLGTTPSWREAVPAG
jgi:hypothetical protein